MGRGRQCIAPIPMEEGYNVEVGFFQYLYYWSFSTPTVVGLANCLLGMASGDLEFWTGTFSESVIQIQARALATIGIAAYLSFCHLICGIV